MRGAKYGAVLSFALVVLCLDSVAARAQTFNFQVCNVLRPGFETSGWAYSGGQL
jgi:hypothetical protein